MNENINLSAVIKDAFSIFRKAFWRILGAFLFGVAIYAAFALLASLFGGKPGLAAPLTAFLLLVTGFVIQSIIQLSLVRIALKNLSFGNAVSSSFSDWKPAVLTAVLMTAATYGGTLFLAIPGIIFSIWFAFSLYVFADEGLSGKNALMRSKSYVVGRWWKTLGFLILGGLITTAPLFIASIGFAFHKIIGFIILALSIAFVLVFSTAYITALYKALADSRSELRSSPVSNPGWFEKAAVAVGIVVFVATIALSALFR